MSHVAPIAPVTPCRLAGEDAPASLALAFSLAGLLLAVVAALLALGAWPMPTATPVHSTAAAPGANSTGEPAPARPAVMPPKPAELATPLVPVEPAPVSRPDCPPALIVMFAPGSVKLHPAEQAKLQSLTAWLRQHPQSRLLLEGYADSTGDEQTNLVLSYRRAKAVASDLGKAGVAESQLAVRAAGEHQAIPGLPDNAADYRRVHLQIEGGQDCQHPTTKP